MSFGMMYRRLDAHTRTEAGYWHPVEMLPEHEIRVIQDKRLVEQMDYLADRSEFYGAKFSAAGLRFSDIVCVDDLRRVPFTTKDELRRSLQASPPFGEHLAAGLDEIVQMQSSSGTSGSPAYVALTESDLEMWNELSARGLFSCGVRPGDFVLHGFSMSKGFVGGVPVLQALQYMAAIDVPVGADGGIERLLRAAADVRPRCIVATPNFLLHLAGEAPRVLGIEATALGVERVIVGGEPGGGIPAVRAAIEEAWGATCCEVMGGTDLGVIYWGECDDQSGMHMLCQDHIIVELIDPGTGDVLPFEAGARGELVYTAIGRQASPLVRFRSGDHVDVLATACRCGRSGPKIRCVGRTDDMLIVRGVNVFPSAIQSIIMDMQPRTSGVVRVLADFDGHTTQSRLKLIVERGMHLNEGADLDLAVEVEDTLRAALAFKAEVTIVPADSFEKPGVQKVSLVLRDPSQIPLA
jgi:phenylacetate-CoA ligase